MNAHNLKPSTAAKTAPHQRFAARVAQYHRRSLAYANALENTFRAETVHRLRTHLRRLQSYAEFLEREKAAERLGRAVSWFSRLRALYELQRYLGCMHGSSHDLRRVKEALNEEQTRVRHVHYPERVKQLVTTITVDSLMRPGPFIMTRLEQSQLENRTKLHDDLQKLPSKPKRKELHALRLLIKSLRYQQEILAEIGSGNPRSVQALKRLQDVLGKYGDLEQFMRSVKDLDLRCRKAIKKDRRKARKRARRIIVRLKSHQMHPLLPLRRPVSTRKAV